jgi:hypothetical protein
MQCSEQGFYEFSVNEILWNVYEKCRDYSLKATCSLTEDLVMCVTQIVGKQDKRECK